MPSTLTTSALKKLSILVFASTLISLPVAASFAQDQMTPEEIEALLKKPKQAGRNIVVTPKEDAPSEEASSGEMSAEEIDQMLNAKKAPHRTKVKPEVRLSAGEMSAEDIQQKLKPKKKTRSIKVMPREQAKAQIDTALDGDIGVAERKKIVEVTQKAELPSLDFSINFGFDSAEIDQNSFATLDTLAEALKSGDLSTYRFLINGHSDSKGSDDYNLALSQHRADSVAQYLISKHDIDPARLKAIGFGESSLKDVNDSEAAANRRVEIVNRP
jgi:outer membrane protein OmpA-like peptidoglycan-associated protein